MADIPEVDWTKTMQQTYEFYQVDPETWGNTEIIDTIESCTITRDSSNETKGHASVRCSEELEECYMRIYLIVIQNGYRFMEPLGTYLLQTPSVSFNGKRKSITADAYSPLLELKEKYPAVGYSAYSGDRILDLAERLCSENMRAPVVGADSTKTLISDFVADLSDTMLSYLTDLIAEAGYSFDVDPMGEVLFSKDADIGSLRPVWTYTDDNSSILLPTISDDRDMYGLPNVVEVVYSDEHQYLISTVTNNSVDSPISTVNRGRQVVYRVANPSISGTPTQSILDAYAKQLLRNLSCLEHTITYTHGYCPVRVGDCVRLNYTRAGMENVIAQVTSQTIECQTGCTVEETAVYTTQLWR